MELEERRSESKTWKALFCVNLINSTQAALGVVGIPSLSDSAQFTSHQLTILLAVFPIAAGLSALITGPISDLIGRKNTLVAGLSLLGLSLALHGIANQAETLIALRFFAGIATGSITGLPASLLSDNFRKERHQSLNAKMLCGYAIGQTIGIPGGIALLEWTSFNHICSGLGFIALALIPIARHFLPGRNPSRYVTKNWIKEYARTATSTVRNAFFARIATSSFLSFTALSTFYVTFALWLFQSAGLRPTEIAPMYLCGGLLQVGVFVFLIPRLKAWPTMKVIAASLAANAALFILAYPFFQNVIPAAALFSLTLGIVSLRVPGFQFLVNYSGPDYQKGLRTTIVQSFNQSGKAAGAALGGTLFQHIKMHHIALICAILIIFSCLFLLLEGRKGRNLGQSKERLM
ncbi:MFS transporter [Pelagicoccus albus]|uniref:MFS transporter n=1 Tax=Pelagicoccus albus TaxID=415222 RepID=A0A7X1B6E6_9BACT|nr:MFS transporter [Pelagicoccus albus]MBC2606511.1 MFS transporter [Pelagicoccus albus]